MPVGVGILGALLIVGGLFDLVAGTGLFPVADPSAFGIPILALLVGSVYLASGIGFLKKLEFAWYIGLAISFLDIARRLIVVFFHGDIISFPGIFVDQLIIIYLLQARVQQYFNIGKHSQQILPTIGPPGQ